MFLLEYIKNPRFIGAVAPSGKYLADEMINSINFEKARYIVEFGPGTGVFTEKILSRVKDDTIVILVEINKEFYNILRGIYRHKKNVIIVNDSAENIDLILKRYDIESVDYILSGIPFASLPKEVSNNILNKTVQILGKESMFITFQYSLLKLNLFKKFFNEINYEKVIRNFPPAYVLKCKL